VVAIPLRSGSFLQILPQEDADALIGDKSLRWWHRGEHLIREGEKMNSVFIVMLGWAAVSAPAVTGNRVTLALKGPGDIIGAEAAVDSRAPISAVNVLRDSLTGFAVDASHFRSCLERSTSTWRAVYAAASQQLDLFDQLRMLAPFPGFLQVATLLRLLATQYGTRRRGKGFPEFTGENPTGDIDLPPMTQEQLASWIGVSRLTVARALQRLREHGAVRTGNRGITITDFSLLTKYVTGAVELGV
jgi:CRP/FNR family transcriptional regulator, cyclic AMP receptor protein